MLEQFSSYFNPSRWDGNTYLVLGLALCGLLCLVVPLVLRKRPRPPQPSVPPAVTVVAGSGDAPSSYGSAATTGDSSWMTRERRATPRRKGNPIEVLLSDATGKGPQRRGRVVDRSLGGLCVAVPDPVPVGTILSVRPATAPPSVPWVQVEVRNQRDCESRWELGCAFVHRPPLNIILLFG
jgi:hypothetical protein